MEPSTFILNAFLALSFSTAALTGYLFLILMEDEESSGLGALFFGTLIFLSISSTIFVFNSIESIIVWILVLLFIYTSGIMTGFVVYPYTMKKLDKIASHITVEKLYKIASTVAGFSSSFYIFLLLLPKKIKNTSLVVCKGGLLFSKKAAQSVRKDFNSLRNFDSEEFNEVNNKIVDEMSED